MMNGKYIVYALFAYVLLHTTNTTSIHDELASLRNRMDQLEEENLVLKLGYERLTSVTENQGKVLQECLLNNTVLAGNKRRRSFPEVPYAFTAVLDHEVVHAGIDQTVIFNKVLLNDGNAYNPHTGVFTVQTAGVYMFYMVFASGFIPHQVWMHIVVDGSAKVAGVADTLQHSHDAQGTNLVMLSLNKGDSVWVTTYRFADVTIYGSSLFTTFSGILLYQY